MTSITTLPQRRILRPINQRQLENFAALRRRKPIIQTRRPPVRPGFPGAAPVDPLINQANNTVFSMFNPLVQRLGQQRAAAEAGMRRTYEAHGSALDRALQATAAPIAQSFDTGIAQSAQVNDAVAKRLSSQGAEASGSLAAKLAQIGADPGGASALAQTYRGASNAGFVKDSADLQHLIGRRSEALSYQGKLPGIARLAANQDLAQALSEARGEFGERETALHEDAVNQAFGFYGQLRNERTARQEAARDSIEAARDRAAKDKMALRALAATAQTNAEKRMYQMQEKALDRQLKADIAQLNANTRLATDNPPAAPKPPSRTGPANQKFITVNGKVIKNPNYVPPSKSGAAGDKNDTWLTPGSAKRDRATQKAWNAVVSSGGGWNGDLLRKLRKYPRSADAIINTAINQALRATGVSNPQHPSAKAIRDAIRSRLSGRTWMVEGYDEPFTFTVGGK